MIRPILQKGNRVLRAHAKSVALAEIGSTSIKKIIRDMHDTLHASEDGIALAAPQIGESLCIFIVAGNFFPTNKKTASEVPEIAPDMVCINPRITKHSTKKIPLEEGCLSVRSFYGQIDRHEKVTITALDENGKTVTRGAKGLLAQVFQHEIDHLNGVLFIDTARGVKKVIPPAPETKHAASSSVLAPEAEKEAGNNK